MMRVLVLTLIVLAGSVSAQQGWRLETSNAPWMERGHHGSFVFNNEMWVFDGQSASGGPQPEDGWSSSDGVNWNHQYTYSAPPDPLPGGTPVRLVFNGQRWVLGGGDSSRVVRSSDGVNWTQEPDAPWVGRGNLAGVVYDGRMWIFGGWTHQPPNWYALNDVWSTPDGVNWTQEVAAAAWSARANHEAVVFNNRMWVIGGADGQQFTREVWSSTDGVNWVQETGNAGWEGRMSFQSVVYRNRIWLFGGEISGQHTPHHFLNDVWSSDDGVNWKEETDSAPWGERAYHGAVVYNDRIWLTGGGIIGIGYLNDVWSYGLHVSPDALPDAIVDRQYTGELEAREGDGPFTWTLTSGSLPPGMMLDTQPTTATIPVTGTPETTGEFTFTVEVEDGDGHTAEQEISLTINPPPPIGDDGNGSSSGTGCTAAPGGLPWTLLYGALTLTAAAILRRRACPE